MVPHVHMFILTWQPVFTMIDHSHPLTIVTFDFYATLFFEACATARSAEEILVLLDDEVDFDFVNLVTALHRIAKTGSQYSNDPRL